MHAAGDAFSFNSPPLEHECLGARVHNGPLDERGAAREPERREQQHHEDEEQIRLAHRRVVRRGTRPVTDQVVRESHDNRQNRAEQREHQRGQVGGHYGAHLRQLNNREYSTLSNSS